MGKLSKDFETDQIYTLIVSSDYTVLPPGCIDKIRDVVYLDHYLNGNHGFSKKANLDDLNVYILEDKRSTTSQSHARRNGYHLSELNDYMLIHHKLFSDEGKFTWRNQAGLLPKRLAKSFKLLTGGELSNDALTAIGNIVRSYSLKDKEYYFDITRNFTWRAGDFSDHMSCFWTNRTDIRTSMEADNRFHAIRFFKKREYENGMPTRAYTDQKLYYDNEKEKVFYTGIARAWFTKETITLEPTNDVATERDVYVLFNGYGMATKEMSTVFTSFLGMNAKSIPLSNNRQKHAGLYVNGDGFIIGDQMLLDKVTSYDFGLPNSIDESKYALVKTYGQKGSFGFSDGLKAMLNKKNNLVYKRLAA